MASSDRSNWLCVAYAFPPINRSGTHRTLGFVKHLDRLGWDATVLTVKPDGEPLDESLLKRVPASTTVLRTPWVNLIERIKRLSAAVPGVSRRSSTRGQSSGDRPTTTDSRQSATSLREWGSRVLMTPDSRVGWIVPAYRAGLQAVRRRRPNVIYSTSPYMSAHLIALLLSRRTRVPWVADFRDPWRGNPFRELGFVSLERWDSWLERTVLRHATHVVCNTPTMTEQLCQRVPYVARKCTTVLNGFDSELFDTVERKRIAPAEDFVLTHCGQFYGPRSPRVWFSALRRVAEGAPESSRRVHLVLIGPDTFDGHSLRDLAVAAGVADRIRILGIKGHSETLSYMAGSDALILAGATGHRRELQIPNKLFEYLALRKPIITTLSQSGPGVAILKQARAVGCVCGPEDEKGIARAIRDLADGSYREDERAWTGVGQFERARRAEELAGLFERLGGCGAIRRGYPSMSVAGPAPVHSMGPGALRPSKVRRPGTAQQAVS
jgi:glycosyltransferase involved in cell wall biosynthesis